MSSRRSGTTRYGDRRKVSYSFLSTRVIQEFKAPAQDLPLSRFVDLVTFTTLLLAGTTAAKVRRRINLFPRTLPSRSSPHPERKQNLSPPELCSRHAGARGILDRVRPTRTGIRLRRAHTSGGERQQQQCGGSLHTIPTPLHHKLLFLPPLGRRQILLIEPTPFCLHFALPLPNHFFAELLSAL
jgi:hypothetical protein